jgi:pimeloyl-ACP methyl ester carboxylesterase
MVEHAGYKNPNVTGLVYVAAFAPDEGQSISDFVDITKLPNGFLMFDKGRFAYINSPMFHDGFAKDVNASEADIMAVVQKPTNQSILAEKSGPPAWKELPTWYQISESDRVIPPDVQRIFAERMNATTLSLDASHASLVSHPNEIAELILNATKGIR